MMYEWDEWIKDDGDGDGDGEGSLSRIILILVAPGMWHVAGGR